MNLALQVGGIPKIETIKLLVTRLLVREGAHINKPANV
jgi:hypothetical protein